MLIIIVSRSSLKLGHVGSKTRSLGQQATQVSDLGPLWPSCCYSLRNEFHFSYVYGSVNYIGSLVKLMNPEGVHVNFASNPV